MNDRRQNPTDLLHAVEKLEKKDSRGKLRVFLGMCPGVGKTYSMLKSGKEQISRGKNVIIGVVETHGRKETLELTHNFTSIQKKQNEYKGSTLLEMDLDVILNAKPDIVLVDELAHTNAPGSRHTKRYQDVEEILNAGIDVYTTLNIQHIESRNDQVAQITGIQVRETVPDLFLENADQIELIDLAPNELLHRMSEGKVYLGEGAELAAKNFFKVEHLTALRELALRFTAEKVDQDLSEQMIIKGIEGPWNTNERLLVAISYSPYTNRLIRAARRMAYNLEAPWIALYVDTGEILSDEDQRMLQKNISKARELGAEVITLAHHDINLAIQKICAEKNVTQIIMGRPDRRFFRDFKSGGTLLDQLVRTTSKIDVHVIRADRKPLYRGFKFKLPEFKTPFTQYYNATWFLIGVSLISYAALPYVGYQALGSVFLLAILVVSSLASKGPIIYSAILSAIVWDFFFIAPQFTFTIHTHEDLMMLGTFFVAALVGGYLTSKIKRQEENLQNRELHTRNLYEFGKSITDKKDTKSISLSLAYTIENQILSEVKVVLAVNKKLTLLPYQEVDEKSLAVAQWTLDNQKPAGWSTQTLAGSPCLCLPMLGNTGAVGVVLFYPKKKINSLTLDQETFLNAAISQASIAIERLQFQDAAALTKIYEASEKLHQTLLNSVSHELRTPITAIVGSSSALKDEATLLNKKSRDSLVDGLVQSANRLNRVVENLLDMSRIEQGSLQLKKEWFEIDELLNEVKTEMSLELMNRSLNFTGPIHTLIEGDFRLLKHALNNLILNAIRYSPEINPIEMDIQVEPKFIHILVKDYGSGIPEGKENIIFDKFYRLPGTPAGGLGLGLSIVKNIIELHEGLVRSYNRDQGTGAIFDIQLPLRKTPESLKEIIR